MITEEQKQEAERVAMKYLSISLHGITAYESAIQDRQSVLEAIMPLHSYCTTLELHDKIMNEIQSLTNQIEYLKSKL